MYKYVHVYYICGFQFHLLIINNNNDTIVTYFGTLPIYVYLVSFFDVFIILKVSLFNLNVCCCIIIIVTVAEINLSIIYIFFS